MKITPIPDNEIARLQKLKSLSILDTQADERFDQITRAAALLCDTEVALISFTDSDRQWFKAKHGVLISEIPRDISFCAHAIMGEEIFIVENAENDARFSDNLKLKNTLKMRFYAGVPLVFENKFSLGALCVMDSKEKKLTQIQITLLKSLAQNVVNLLELQLEKLTSFENRIMSDGINAFAMVAKTDSNGIITYVNDMFCSTSKYSRQELIGQDHRILNSGFHPKSFFENMWSTIKDKEIWRGEVKNKTKDGASFWIDSTIIPNINSKGEIEGYTSFKYDITERKRTEQFLISEQKKHEVIFYQSKDATMTLGPPSWKFTSANPAALALFEVKSVNDFTTLGPWDLSPIRQPDGSVSADKAKEMVMNALDSGSHYFEWTYTTINGREIPCTVLLSKIIENNNVYLQAVVRDVSKEKKLEKEIWDANKYLDLAVEGTDLGIWDWNLNDNSVKFSEMWAKLRGVTISDLKMNISDWESRVHPDDLPEAYEKIGQYLSGKTTHYECIHRVRHSNGRWLHILGKGKFSDWDQTGKPIRFTGTDLDISELISTKIKLDLFFEEAPYGFAFCDEQGKFIEFNKEFERIVGYSLEEINRLSYWDLTPEKYARDEEEQLKILRETRRYGPYIKEYITKSQKLVSVKLNGFLVDDYGGKKGIWSIVEDITDKKFAEDEVKRVTNQLTKFFDLALNYLCIADINGYFIKLNSSWSNLGYGLEELTSQPFINFVHPDDLAATYREVEKLSQGQMTIRFENRYRKKDGSYIHLEWATTPDPETGLLYAGATDVTERRKREEINILLSRVRSHFIDLLGNKDNFFEYLIKEIIFLTSAQYGFIGEILEENDVKYLKTFAQNDISWIKAVAAFELRDENSLFSESISLGKMYIKNEPGQSPSENRFLITSFMSIPIFYNNNYLAMIGVANKNGGFFQEDFENLKPFIELCGEMIHSIKISEELENQKKISIHQSKLASVGELAAGVGHEINNPLAIIQGQLEMMSSYMVQNKIKDDFISSKIEKSQNSVIRIMNIVRGLKVFARSDEVEFSDFNLDEMLKETVNLLFEIFSKDGISLVYSHHGSLWVNGNRGRLQQAVVNLINNAKDAVLEMSVKKILITATNENNKIIIVISDTGPGVPESIQEKIFDPFFTTKKVNSGTGIGLALVSSILKEHHGSVELDRRFKEGAKFILTIPSIANPDRKILEPLIHPTSSRYSGTVLVVDDEDGIREILQFMLESLGLNVLLASDGKEALDLISNKTKKIDLVISDMKMREMSGIELARLLRNEQAFTGGIFFITGGINVKSDEYKNLVNGVLSKPCNEMEIVEAISKWVRKIN